MNRTDELAEIRAQVETIEKKSIEVLQKAERQIEELSVKVDALQKSLDDVIALVAKYNKQGRKHGNQ